MLTLDQKIKKWSRKVNRNKTFTPIEMEEMEDHLLVEIKQMVQYDHLNEEEAFRKATETLGEQGILDEEYGKIRWSAFLKVKLWAYLQTFIILGLVVFLVVPYIHFPEKNKNGFVVGKEIGEISRWAYDGSKNSASSFVPYKNEVFFYNHDQGNINSYWYHPHKIGSLSITLNGTYFASTPNNQPIFHFDMDSNKDIYFLDWDNKRIDVYQNTKKIKVIPVPVEMLKVNVAETIRVLRMTLIDRKVVLSLTISKTELVNQNKEMVKNDLYSGLLIYDQDSKSTKWDLKKLKNIAMSVNRSEDEMAILYIDGSVEIYNVKSQKLAINDTFTINNFSSFLRNHRIKPKDSFQAKMTTKFVSFRKSILSVFKPKSKIWKLGWLDLIDYEENDTIVFEKDDLPKKSKLTELISKIKNWKIFGNYPKPTSNVAVRFHLKSSDADAEPIDEAPWKYTPDHIWWGRTGFMMPNAQLAKDTTIPTMNIPATSENLFFTRPILWTMFYKDRREPWYVVLDDAGQLWFDPDGRFNDPRYNARADINDPNFIPGKYTNELIDNLIGNNTQGPYIKDPSAKESSLILDPILFQTIDHTYSNCNISLLFSKSGHQMVLVENSNQFSYLVPNGKQLQILPLTDKDIAGVMKLNYIDPERLSLVKYPTVNLLSEPLSLYLFKN